MRESFLKILFTSNTKKYSSKNVQSKLQLLLLSNMLSLLVYIAKIKDDVTMR